MKFIVPVFVGAIIGYITNWLAIKMLFRPYEKKYIFGIPVPFTPGLIPKEQKRIAKSVGDTVGEYLLSEEIIMENIEKAKLDEKINSALKEKLVELRENKISIRDIIEYLDFKDYEDLKIIVTNNILSAIIKNLKREDSRKKVLKLLDDLIDRIDYKAEVENIKILLTEYIDDLEDSKELEVVVKNEIQSLINKLENEDRQLNELIEPEKVNSFIEEHSYIIVNILKDCIDDFTIADKFKALLNNVIENNISRTIRMFVSPDVISEKIYKIIEGFIYEEEFEEKLKPILGSASNKFMDYRISDILGEFKHKLTEENIDKLSNFIVEKILKQGNKERFIDIIGQELKSKEDIILENIRSRITCIYDELLNDEVFTLSIYNFIGNSLDNLSRVKLSLIMGKIDSKYLELIIDRLTDFLIRTINTKVPKIVSLFNISKVVEDEINKFEVDFAEEIILEIASKELKAITWLGALLGAIMGIISPLLQMI